MDKKIFFITISSCENGRQFEQFLGNSGERLFEGKILFRLQCIPDVEDHKQRMGLQYLICEAIRNVKGLPERLPIPNI